MLQMHGIVSVLRLSKKMKTAKRFVYIFLILFVFAKGASTAEYELVTGVIHMDSEVSGGDLSLEKMVELAKEANMKYAIFTDHDTMKWEYGVRPLRKIIKKTIEKGSIQQYGSDNYIEDIEYLNEEYPKIIVMPGAEAIPFYYWEGGYFSGDMALINGHEHLLVFGLRDAEDYENLPSIGRGFPRRFTKDSLIMLWPLVFFFLAWRFYYYKRIKSIQNKKMTIRKEIRPLKIPGYVFFGFGLIFLLNNAPFSTPLYDQYHGRNGVGPFQHLIDYVNEKDGLVFWAHPEVNNDWYDDGGGIAIKTASYHEDLLKTHGYTGFAVFAEGIKYIAPPGGIWDQTLAEYCVGIRKKPVWAIGELDFEGESFSIDDTQTVLLLKKKKIKYILKALKTGKMYAIHRYSETVPQLLLNEFVIEDDDGIETAYMGDEILLDTNPSLKIKITSESEKELINAKVIRNGEIVKKISQKGTIDVKFDDNYYEPGKKAFYRLDIESSSRIISNPIFVQFL